MHTERDHAHAHAARGGPGDRAPGPPGGPPADRRVQVGHRHRDLHLPPGRAAEQPGTDELMVEALKTGGSVVGAAPYTDTNPHGQIDRIFAIAREFDIDIDMHLDFGPTADDLDLVYVCELAERFKWGGRVAIGHVTKLSA